MIFKFFFPFYPTSLPMSRTSDIPQNHIKEPLAFLRKAQVCVHCKYATQNFG